DAIGLIGMVVGGIGMFVAFAASGRAARLEARVTELTTRLHANSMRAEAATRELDGRMAAIQRLSSGQSQVMGTRVEAMIAALEASGVRPFGTKPVAMRPEVATAA